MINDKNMKVDGFQAVTQGVDSGRAPSVLDRTQLAWLVNGTTRGSFPASRPGFNKRSLDFRLSDGTTDTATQSAFTVTGRWQGAHSYVTDQGNTYLVASIGGHIFRIDTSNYAVLDLTADLNDFNSPIAPQAWFCQAENYLIIQNGEDVPFIFDGATLRRSSPGASGGNEVPSGTVMEYNNGRLWVTLPDGYRFVAGDLVYSDPSQPGGGRGSVLKFTENIYLDGGGFFAIPFSAGPIRAMRSIAAQDSATGQGPMQILTTRGGFSINAPFDRTQWQNTTSPIQSISLLAAGAVAQDSTQLVNGDIWFRAPDGVRSFMIARRDHGTWVNTPLSREMTRSFDSDQPELLCYSSAVLFDNRYLVTNSPYVAYNPDRIIRGVPFRGLAVLDFAPVSQMFNSTRPNWDGIWTGLAILQVLTTDADRTRAFAFALNTTSAIELWEISLTDRFDNGSGRIQWAFETPEYGYDDGGWSLKQLSYADLWLDRLAGQVNFSARYREDRYPFWRTWHQWEDCALIQDCGTAACAFPEPLQEQYRARVRLPSLAGDCDEVTGKPSTQGYRFALRMEITGSCELKQLRLISRSIPEVAEGGCPPNR